MKSNQARKILLALLVLLAIPLALSAQTRRPRLRRPAPRTVTPVLVPVATNLKIRLNDTLSSKDSRVGDKFTATVIDPVRFNEATVRGHIRSIIKSGKVTGRTTMNLTFDSIELSDGRHGILHGYVTKGYGTDPPKADEEGALQSKTPANQTLTRTALAA